MTRDSPSSNQNKLSRKPWFRFSVRLQQSSWGSRYTGIHIPQSSGYCSLLKQQFFSLLRTCLQQQLSNRCSAKARPHVGNWWPGWASAAKGSTCCSGFSAQVWFSHLLTLLSGSILSNVATVNKPARTSLGKWPCLNEISLSKSDTV